MRLRLEGCSRHLRSLLKHPSRRSQRLLLRTRVAEASARRLSRGQAAPDVGGLQQRHAAVVLRRGDEGTQGRLGQVEIERPLQPFWQLGRARPLVAGGLWLLLALKLGLPLIAVALIYLVLVMFFSWLVSKLERRLRNSDH